MHCGSKRRRSPPAQSRGKRLGQADASFDAPLTVLEHDVLYTAHADGTYRRDERSRIRINTLQAVQSEAQTYVPYSESQQRWEVPEAYTETPAGRRVLVASDRIVTQQSPASADAPAFNDVKLKAIAFPQVAPGALGAHARREHPLACPLSSSQPKTSASMSVTIATVIRFVYAGS